MAGMDRVRYLLALRRIGVSVIHVGEEELKLEFAPAREAFAGHQWQSAHQLCHMASCFV